MAQLTAWGRPGLLRFVDHGDRAVMRPGEAGRGHRGGVSCIRGVEAGEGSGMNTVCETAWTTPFEGAGLRGRCLVEELGAEVTLLVFLRHLG